MTRCLCWTALLFLLVAGVAAAQGPLLQPPKDLADDVPEFFPRFWFKGHDERAQLLGNYLWYHFKNRTGRFNSLFNQEYLTCSDMWVSGASTKRFPMVIQKKHRENLLSMKFNPDGYVHTNQHFSHCHEQGWPFPMWFQIPGGPKGVTAGWHFEKSGPGWVWDYFLNHQKDAPWSGENAMKGWELDDLKSHGIVGNVWKLESDGRSPTLTTPEGFPIDAFNAPYLQIRMNRTGNPDPKNPPYVEWLREEDGKFGRDRRVPFDLDSGNPGYEGVSKTQHYMAVMHAHPLWKGRIKRMRIALAPGERGVRFEINSFFTVYDTRHTINDPILIIASWYYFRWTGDVEFLREQMPRMRTALKYQQDEMGGLEHKHIRNEWPGHDGLPGFTLNADGSKNWHPGHGIGSNYWDLLPFGWDDFYATYQYHRATLIMADLEEAVAGNPSWKIPRGHKTLNPTFLHRHAADVREAANEKFWNKEAGRFVACIDKNGKSWDYGFTFLNLDAIWYGIASDEHAKAILDWIGGKRVVEGDTSKGKDIYHWRFGPRATTKRNIDWYHWGWGSPEGVPWGGQVQDGGAVLGFSFYDLWARLQVLGPDDAWQRLKEILDWEKEVHAEGGYRKYYEGGKRGTTLQGGGTAGGLGIDHEFYESSLIPSIVIYGFLGINPQADAVTFEPKLPEDCPEMGATNILLRGVLFDIKVDKEHVELRTKTWAKPPFKIMAGSGAIVTSPGIYRLRRK